MRWKGMAVAGLAVVFALGTSCSDGPTALVGFAIGGEWIEVSTLEEDQCESGLPATVMTEVTVIYGGGTTVTFVYHTSSGDFSLSGAFNPDTHEFTLPFAGGSAIGQQTGIFTSESDYTSTTTIFFDLGGGETCEIVTHEVGQRA